MDLQQATSRQQRVIKHLFRRRPTFNSQQAHHPSYTTMNTTLPVTHGKHAAEPAQYGVYDKPADRRLAPWITIGSIILMVCSFSSHSPSRSTPFFFSYPTTPLSSLHSITLLMRAVVIRCMPHRLHLRQARNCELPMGLPHQWNHPCISWPHWTPCRYHS